MNKEPFSLDEFMVSVGKASAKHPNWRHGQVLFNVLYGGWPEIADKIRGSSADPFHYKGGEVVDRFWEYLIMIGEKGDV